MESFQITRRQEAVSARSLEKCPVSGASVKAPESGHAGGVRLAGTAVMRDAHASPVASGEAYPQCLQRCEAKPKSPSPAPIVRIALVDGERRVHSVVRAAIDDLTKGSWAIESHATGREALETIALNPPCAVLTEIALPDISGTECVRRLKRLLPALPVVIHTAQRDGASVLLSVMAGASGWLVKPVAPRDIVATLAKAMQGEPCLCSVARAALFEALRRAGEIITRGSLSPREAEVLGHIAKGFSDKEIAAALGVETGTAHAHVAAVLKKMGAHSRREACLKSLGLP